MKENPILKLEEDDNPLGMLTNLFDAAMVFAVALMVALVTHYSMNEIFSKEDFTVVKNPGAENMEIIMKEGGQVKKYVPSESGSSQGSRGKRVGSAYRLENGEIIYIPE
ncbi:MAG: DUF2149 domain-containing protein [Alistipes sp.]|nr:DUF2149 domain-containing protein [Alistipes sp.]MDE7069085.1 DUF2149 domain-containing protein [Alistipes sp.]